MQDPQVLKEPGSTHGNDPMLPPDLNPLNQREFRKLVLSIKANAQRLDLLLAICDDRNLQDILITAYEAELKTAGINPFRARLNPKQPSLRATLEDLVAQESALQSGEAAVVTVLNANELLGVRLTEDTSEQERFFFSLQWTREALRQFEFPILLWLSDSIATRLAQQAPDFWSWRSGLFEFVAHPQQPTELHQPLQLTHELESTARDSQLSIEDLQQQIAQLEQTTPESPLLVTLYNALGKAYEGQYTYQQALECYEKALKLAKAKNDLIRQAISLRNLGNSLRYCGRSFQSLGFYEQALALYRESEDRNNEAAMLNQLGNAYYSLGQYPQAIDFHQQSLVIAREMGDRQGEAASLGGLGNAYSSLGQYQQAINFYQQSLDIARKISNLQSEAAALGNLGLAYSSLGQYQQAINCYQQSLNIARRISNRQNEAAALGNLGLAYDSLGQYRQAIDFHQQNLAIAREIGDRQSESKALGNLGLAYSALGQYRQAIDFHQQNLAIAREIGDRQNESKALGNLGLAYNALGQYRQAIDFHQQNLAIAREIGDRRGEANSLFNLGNALARVDQKWEARASYEIARTLYEELGLHKKVEDCNVAIRDLGKRIVAIPKQAPTIGDALPRIPDWLKKSMPTVNNTTPRASQKLQIPVVVWFLVGLGLALLVWWLVQ